MLFKSDCIKSTDYRSRENDRITEDDMVEMIAFCGFRCDLCPAFIKNKGNYPDKRKISEGWKKYFDIAISPDDIICAGCRMAGKQLDRKCVVRSCAKKKKIQYCILCPTVESCKKLESRTEPIESAKWTFGGHIPPMDYRLFFEPYDSKKYFKKVKKGIKKKR
jgi:hypothetical protein